MKNNSILFSSVLFGLFYSSLSSNYSYSEVFIDEKIVASASTTNNTNTNANIKTSKLKIVEDEKVISKQLDLIRTNKSLKQEENIVFRN